MKIINEYNLDSTIRKFSDLDLRLIEYYDKIIDISSPFEFTTRAALDKRIGFRDIYYYISFLYEHIDPAIVLDLGSGDGLFKEWFPNIYCVDIQNNYKAFNVPDEYIVLDEFLSNNKNKFDAGMAINSLHFAVSTVDEFIDYVNRSMNLLRNNGRFLFTINYSHFVSKQKYRIDKISISKSFDIEIFTRLVDKSYDIILYDPIYSRGFTNTFNPNGDLRFILQK